MKRKTIITTEEYDENGVLKTKITETTEEEDTGYIYPQSPVYPIYPQKQWEPTWNVSPKITCGTELNLINTKGSTHEN